MPSLSKKLLGIFVLITLIGATKFTQAQVSVLTQKYNNARTGANLSETVLNTSNVNINNFGMLFSRPVDGQIYAQPLYMPNLNIGGKVRNVVFVATMHDSVYAFDADDPNANTPLWYTPFLNPTAGIYSVPYPEVTWTPDIAPEIGITSTPVIDPNTSTIYVVAKTKEVSGGNTTYPHRLHALDIFTGQEKPNSPVLLQAEVPGEGDGSYTNPSGIKMVPFNTKTVNQRPALTLSNGVLYIASASHGDVGPYHGWILSYHPQTLALISAFNTTPNGGLGGIWQSGQGLAVDASGNLYFATGNGSFDEAKNNYGDSYLKMSTNAGVLSVADYFTPYNQDYLNQIDADLGVGGVMLIPDSNLLIGGGKEGRLYLMQRDNMGKYNPTKTGATDDSQIRQWFWGYNAHLHGTPIYWQGPQGRTVYLWSENDHGKAYRYLPDLSLPNGIGGLETTAFAQTAMQVPEGMPGVSLQSLQTEANPEQESFGRITLGMVTRTKRFVVEFSVPLMRKQ